MSLGSILSGYWSALQAQSRFLRLSKTLVPWGSATKRFVRVVELVRLSACWHPCNSRQAAERPCGP